MKLGFGGIIGLVLLAIFVFLFFFYRNDLKKVFQEKLNPASDKNLVYEGTNKIVQELTGDKDATLGTKIYEAVDYISGILPYFESDKEKQDRIREEALAAKKSRFSSGELTKNPSYVIPKGDIGIKFTRLPGDVMQFPK